MYKALKQWLIYACILWDDDDGDGNDYVFLMFNLTVYKEQIERRLWVKSDSRTTTYDFKS